MNSIRHAWIGLAAGFALGILYHSLGTFMAPASYTYGA
jgi:hypothetical protein